MSSSPKKAEELLEEIKGVFIQFIYEGAINSAKNQPVSVMYFKIDRTLQKFGYYKEVYKDISEAIKNTEKTGSETDSLMGLYNLSISGLQKFVSDIEKRFRVPIHYSGVIQELSFMTLLDLILESRKE